MSDVREFGFICGELSMGQSNGFVFPRHEQSYFSRSLIPGAEEAELTGRYLLRVYHRGSVVWKSKVEVAWGAGESPEPCLAMKVQDASALSEALGKAAGKEVELRFTRIAQS
jgi:hypothetical protein